MWNVKIVRFQIQDMLNHLKIMIAKITIGTKSIRIEIEEGACVAVSIINHMLDAELIMVNAETFGEVDSLGWTYTRRMK